MHALTLPASDLNDKQDFDYEKESDKEESDNESEEYGSDSDVGNSEDKV